VSTPVDLAVGRRLQVWRYSVSHRELLLVSPRDDAQGTRFYVLLKPVDHINLPTTFDCERITSREGGFTLSGQSGSFFVLAEYLFHGEDSLEYDAPFPIGVAVGS
jgi:hypothetical protein